MTEKTIFERFDEEFRDLTHTGHASQHPNADMPCATVKDDVKDFFRQNLTEVIEGMEIDQYGEVGGGMTIRVDKLKEKLGLNP